MQDYQSLCHDCGVRLYGEPIRPEMMEGITVGIGHCRVCGEEKGIVPARDWLNACRTDREPNPEEWD